MPKWKTPGQNEPTHFYQKTQMKSSQDYACSSRFSLDEVFTPYGVAVSPSRRESNRFLMMSGGVFLDRNCQRNETSCLLR
jgi:hypothetical protein